MKYLSLIFLALLASSCIPTEKVDPTLIEPDYFIHFKADGVLHKIMLFGDNERYKQADIAFKDDEKVSVRTFYNDLDTVTVDGSEASFIFWFQKANRNDLSKTISFNVEENFVLEPRDYKVADFNICTFSTDADGLAEVATLKTRMFSWQYTWTKNRQPATWKITDIDTRAKTIRGTFSFPATYAELLPASEGETICDRRETFKKIEEMTITEGEFFLPYKEL